MRHLSSLFLLLGAVPFLINCLGLPSLAQSSGQSAQVTNTLTFDKDGERLKEFSINSTPDRANPAAMVGAISLGAGVQIDAVQTAINLTLAGADPDSVSNLMLALTGVVSGGNTVDTTRLALAINAFNSIVDKADAPTLQALQEIPEFTEIREFLFTLRKAIG